MRMGQDLDMAQLMWIDGSGKYYKDVGVVNFYYLEDLKIQMFDTARHLWGLNAPINIIPTKDEIPFFIYNYATNERLIAYMVK